MKKLFSFFCIICFSVLCVGCGNNSYNNNPSNNDNNVIAIEGGNIENYIRINNVDNYGYAAFYIYVTIDLELTDGFVADEYFSVACSFNANFSSVLKEDFTTPVHFSHQEFFYVYFSKGENTIHKSLSLYNLKYKNYAFTSMKNYTLTFSVVHGRIVKR